MYRPGRSCLRQVASHSVMNGRASARAFGPVELEDAVKQRQEHDLVQQVDRQAVPAGPDDPPRPLAGGAPHRGVRAGAIIHILAKTRPTRTGANHGNIGT